ncbi:MAG: CPBP family intramembrane glutamic endopeptidase [Planctomycetota bacterium]
MKRLASDLRSLDFRTCTVLFTSALMLVILQFRGKVKFWREVEWLKERYPLATELDFACQCAWAISTVVAFGLVPFLVAVFVLRLKPAEFGFRLNGFVRHLPVYGGMLLLMSPLLWWAAHQPSFRSTYPFPQLARQDDEVFWIWQFFYFAQFCALEMFFRGFVVFGLEKRFGLNAIFVMTIPYAMIHFSKPMPEAIGAIVAGLTLGYMALRTRSFYGGILLHYAIGLGMDLLARRPLD